MENNNKTKNRGVKTMTQEQYQTIENEINQISDALSKQCDVYLDNAQATNKKNGKEGMSGFFSHWDNFYKQPHAKKMLEQIKSLRITIINTIPPELMDLEPKDTYGNFYSLKEFQENVDCGGIIDSDGLARLMFDDKITDISFYPSLLHHKDIDLSRYSGVAWYNK